MKIICVGRNYPEHAKELNNEIPEEPVIFLKPDTALLRSGDTFYYPDFSSDIHYECELVLKIGKNGKFIKPGFADRYIESVSVGIDFTARDLQKKCKEKGLPWERAKAFDGSAAIGDFVPFNGFEELLGKEFSLKLNGKTVQTGKGKEMMFPPTDILAFISTFITLRKGDLIYTGTPAGVGPVSKGDRLEGFFGDQKLMELGIA